MKINDLRQMYLIHDILDKRHVPHPDYQSASIRREYKNISDYDCYDYFSMYLYTAGCLLMCMIWLYLKENNIDEIDEKDLGALLYKLANDPSVWKTYAPIKNEPFGIFDKCIDKENTGLPVYWHNKTSPDLIRKSALNAINNFFSHNNNCSCVFAKKPETGKLYIYNVFGHFVIIDSKGNLVYDPAGNSITKRTHFENGKKPLSNIKWENAMYLKKE